jgi:hypothetical protein
MPGYWGASRRVAREVRTAARLASPGWQVPIRGTPDGMGSSGGIHRNQCTRTYAGDHQPVDGCRQRTPHSCIRSLQHTRHGGIVRHRHRPQRRTPLAVFGQSTYGCSNHPGLIAPLTQNSGKLGGHPVLRTCAAVGRQYGLADVQRDAGNTVSAASPPDAPQRSGILLCPTAPYPHVPPPRGGWGAVALRIGMGHALR